MCVCVCVCVCVCARSKKIAEEKEHRETESMEQKSSSDETHNAVAFSQQRRVRKASEGRGEKESPRIDALCRGRIPGRRTRTGRVLQVLDLAKGGEKRGGERNGRGGRR